MADEIRRVKYWNMTQNNEIITFPCQIITFLAKYNENNMFFGKNTHTEKMMKNHYLSEGKPKGYWLFFTVKSILCLVIRYYLLRREVPDDESHSLFLLTMLIKQDK